MSLTKKNVKKICKNIQCFSKLLILYPMIHPATMHGLLAESNYDYGFVMQLILKLESQRNALYWEEVARLSNIMEQENLTRMTSHSGDTNQRLSQMAQQMFNSISSHEESSNSNLQISSLMEGPGQETNVTSSEPVNLDARISELLNQINTSSVEFKNVNLQLNQIMQMPESQITKQQVADSNSLRSSINGVFENDINSAPVNETMEITKQPTVQIGLDPNINLPSTAVNMEGSTLFSLPPSNHIKWQMNQFGNIAIAQTLETYSNPNIDPRNIGMMRNENRQAIYLNPANDVELKIFEIIQAAKSQIARLRANSNMNVFVPGMSENHLSQVHFSNSSPNYPNLQGNNMEQTLNLQSIQSQLLSNNINQLNDSNSTTAIKWPNSDIKEESQNLQYTESELHLNDTTMENSINQTNYINPAPDNTWQRSEVGEIRTPQSYYMNQTPDKATLQIIEIENIQKAQLQNNDNPGLLENQIHQSNLSNIHSPYKNVLNSSNSTRNTDLMVTPLIQQHFELNDTNWQVNGTKLNSIKKGRKPKLNKIKSSSKANHSEVPVEIQRCKPVKRRSKSNDSNLQIKKLRTEVQIIKSSSVPNKNHLGSNSTDMINEQEYQQIQHEIKSNSSKDDQTLQTSKTRSRPRKTSLQRRLEQELYKTEPVSEIIEFQVSKSKKKTQEFDEVIKEENNDDETKIGKKRRNKNRKISKPQLKRNKIKPRKIKKTRTRRSSFEMLTGTDFLSIDPHVTKIEYTPRGQIISVCSNRFITGEPEDEVQFFRTFPDINEKKKQHSKPRKTRSQTIKIKKKQEKIGKECNEPGSKLLKATKIQKSVRSKRQTATYDAESKNSIGTQKKKIIKNKTDLRTNVATKLNDEIPGRPTGGNRVRKAPKGSVICCCQSIGFRKKYKLPPFDTDEWNDLYPDELLFPAEEIKPKGGDPFDPSRESIFDYYERNTNAKQDIKKYFAEKNKKKSTKSVLNRSYNTRSSKEKKT